MYDYQTRCSHSTFVLLYSKIIFAQVIWTEDVLETSEQILARHLKNLPDAATLKNLITDIYFDKPKLGKAIKIAVSECSMAERLQELKKHEPKRHKLGIIQAINSFADEVGLNRDRASEAVVSLALAFGFSPDVLPEIKTEDPSYVTVGSLITFGAYRYRVLAADKKNKSSTHGKLLIMSEGVIDEKLPYKNPLQSTSYADSDIRAFLNGRFYAEFSKGEKLRILKSKVMADSNPWYGTAGGKETEDFLFLLSVREVSMYFGGSGALAKNPQEQFFVNDAYNKNRQAQDGDGKPAWWWLRTPGVGAESVCVVHQDGRICLSGYCVDEIAFGGGGIRPAMWISAI